MVRLVGFMIDSIAFLAALRRVMSACRGWPLTKKLLQSHRAAGLAIAAGFFGSKLPASFLPERPGLRLHPLQLPDAASLERTDEVCKKIEDILGKTPGVKYTTSVIGFSLFSYVQATYNGFFFVTLDEWSKRKKPEE